MLYVFNIGAKRYVCTKKISKEELFDILEKPLSDEETLAKIMNYVAHV